MNFFRKKPPLNQRSQIAVIITFVIAVTILFIVVFINITKVSQIKTSTSQAADKAALGLASQIGSMSHYYAHTVLHDSTVGGKPEVCSGWWNDLSSWAVGTSLPGYISSQDMMMNSISDTFNAMSNFNALRENALFQAAISLQSDDVTLLPLSGNPGFFYEDVNNNGAFDAGEPQYDLSSIPQMRKQNKVDRFTAWYYTKRLPWVSDNGLKTELDKFINGTSSMDGLKDFVDVDEWDSKEWNIKKASYTIKPAATSSGSPKYRTTCTTDCPAWVGGVAWSDDPEKNRKIRIVAIDRGDRDDSNNNYNLTGGFLKDKFMSLAKRINDTSAYSLTFCSSTCRGGGACPHINCGEIDRNNVIIDLTEFLGRTKELFDLPLSERIKGAREGWFSLFYDSAKHKPDRTSIDGSNDHDIYLRLTRDQNYLNTWIHELETLNNTIKTVVASAHGKCTWGKGGIIVGSSCDTIRGPNCVICGSVPHCEGGLYHCCWWCCYNPQPCAWGNYYTCCDSPPVCTNGDLYGAKPGWCSTYKNPDPCANNCPGCDVRKFNCDDEAKSFQGQLSYRPPCVPNDPKCTYIDSTSGPTEVEQAIGILQALSADIARIQNAITHFADILEKYAPKEDPVRNQFVYAWKDKSGYGHLVSVKIEGKDVTGTVTGYPNQHLPYINESKDWIKTCRKLEDYEGSFKITTSHYDQDIDIAAPQWKLRRRQKPSEAEFVTAKLAAMVNDIQNTGKLNPVACCDCNGSYCQSDIDKLLNNYAITSTSQAHYGFEKSGIYIMKTEG